MRWGGRRMLMYIWAQAHIKAKSLYCVYIYSCQCRFRLTDSYSLSHFIRIVITLSRNHSKPSASSLVFLKHYHLFSFLTAHNFLSSSSASTSMGIVHGYFRSLKWVEIKRGYMRCGSNEYHSLSLSSASTSTGIVHALFLWQWNQNWNKLIGESFRET